MSEPSSAGSRRRRAYLINTTILVAAVVGIAVLLNVLAARSDLRADMTATLENTLADQTAAVLSDLAEPVEVSAFFVERAVEQNPTMALARDRLDSLLNQFEDRADNDLTYDFVDPELEPGRARDKGVDQFPVVVVEGENSGITHRYFPSPNLEQDLVTGVLVATGTATRPVYFLTGHGERSVADGADAADAFGLVREGLEADNYAVSTWNLAQQGPIPGDAALVVAAGPTSDLIAEEATLLDEYLIGDGSLLLLLEPNPPPTWRGVLQRWGLRALDGFVVDAENSQFGTPSTLVVQSSQYSPSRITSELDVTYFPGLAPVDIALAPAEMPNLVSLLPLATSGPLSFASLDPARAQPAAGELLGPFAVAIVIEASAPVGEPADDNTTTLAVFGDSDFASNRHFVGFSNGGLLLNTVNELTGDYALIALRARPFLDRQMVITEGDFTVFRFVGWFLVPFLVAAAGVVVWWQRR